MNIRPFCKFIPLVIMSNVMKSSEEEVESILSIQAMILVNGCKILIRLTQVESMSEEENTYMS